MSRRAVGVAIVISASAVGIVFAMAYAKQQAALAPAAWEPRSLPPDWPVDAFTFLCAGWMVCAFVWAIVTLRKPAAPPVTATLPPPGTYGNFVPANPAPDEPPSHWVKPGAARRRYEARRRRVPVIARQRRKHHA